MAQVNTLDGMMELNPGDGVGFKDGYEQYGVLVKVNSGGMLEIRCWDDYAGEYYIETKAASRCWKDD